MPDPQLLDEGVWKSVGAFVAGLLGIRGIQAIAARRSLAKSEDDVLKELRGIRSDIRDHNEKISRGFDTLHRRIDDLMGR